ncbi:MAG: transcription repressor NadR [Lachnospiraceae bacterium]|nr:transcription repressor NadR [Lachnospiraceae bacterium]
MNSEERRKEIVHAFHSDHIPVSGTALSSMFGVSRQIIVQDIALLRAQGYDIISTNRGYLLKTPARVDRVFQVKHTDEQIEEELNAVVDLGGCVRDVYVVHEVYGRICADMGIRSRRQVKAFLDELKSGKSSPLKNITQDTHFHTIEADSQEILDEVERALAEKGFLVRG